MPIKTGLKFCKGVLSKKGKVEGIRVKEEYLICIKGIFVEVMLAILILPFILYHGFNDFKTAGWKTGEVPACFFISYS
jgi:hypothetical protein